MGFGPDMLRMNREPGIMKESSMTEVSATTD